MCKTGGPRCDGSGRRVRTQNEAVNVASGNDVVGVQGGQVMGEVYEVYEVDQDYQPEPETDYMPDHDPTDDEASDEPAEVINMRTGNARVGIQGGEIAGNVNLRM